MPTYYYSFLCLFLVTVIPILYFVLFEKHQNCAIFLNFLRWHKHTHTHSCTHTHTQTHSFSLSLSLCATTQRMTTISEFPFFTACFCSSAALYWIMYFHIFSSASIASSRLYLFKWNWTNNSSATIRPIYKRNATTSGLAFSFGLSYHDVRSTLSQLLPFSCCWCWETVATGVCR